MPQNANLILPSEQVVALSPVHTLTKTEVNLEPADAHNIGGKKFLSKAQVENLGNAAGLRITESIRLDSEETDVILWQAAGEISKPDGQTLSKRSTYALDLRYKERNGMDGAVMLSLLATRLDKARDVRAGTKDHTKGMPPKDAEWKEWERWARDGALSEIMVMDRYRIQRAETGACLRVARSLLNIKAIYTESELKRPFVVYRATFDVLKAMRLGGRWAQMAERGLGLAFGQQLGLSEASIAGLLKAPVEAEEEVKTGLVLLTETEVTELEAFLVEHGLKNRRTADEFSKKIFDQPLSALDARQAALLREMISLSEDAKKVGLDTSDEFKQHVREMVSLAYAEGGQIVEVMDQVWYDKLYPKEPTPAPPERDKTTVKVKKGEVV